MRGLVAVLGVGGLAVATLLAAADPASAQRRWRGGYYESGYGRWYSPGYGWGYGGYGWGNNPYYSSGYPANDNTTGYYDNRMAGQRAPNNFSDFSTGGDAFYGTPDTSYGAQSSFGMNDRNVLIEMQVPPNAEVWFDDQKTSQRGAFRSFISPPLNPDQNYVYHVRTKWTENGRDVERKRRIDVHAGDRLMVNFMRPGDLDRFRYGSERSGQFNREEMNRNTERPGTRDSDRNRDRSLGNRRGTENRDTERAPTDTTRDPRTRTDDRTTTPRTTNPNDTTRPTDTNRPPNENSRPPQ